MRFVLLLTLVSLCGCASNRTVWFCGTEDVADEPMVFRMLRYDVVDGFGTMTAAITDGITGEPLPGALVAVEGTAIQARSDLNGRVTLAGLTPSQTLNITFIDRISLQIPLARLVGTP